MIFKIGSESSGDYSNRVIAGSYNVNKYPLYGAVWDDSNGNKHKDKITDKVSGSFDMFFKDITDYNAFLSLISTSKLNDDSILCTVAVNNDTNTKTAMFFLEFAPTRNRKGDWSDYMDRFTVNITEQ